MLKPFALFFAFSALSTAAHAGPTLEKIKVAHTLSCGVDFEEAEYSTQDAHGNHSAFDLDLCKAIAIAVLGPGAKFTAIPFRDEQDALAALKKGEIAVLATGSPNYMNTAAAGFGFSRPVLYDFQGLMVNAADNLHSARDLSGRKICFLGGTEIESQLTGFMQRQKIAFLPFSFQEEGEMEAAFITHNCAAITADVTQLAYERIAFKGMARSMEILPDVIASDPLALTYRLDDPQWAAILNWIAETLIQAEASGVTQANVTAMKRSEDPTIQRLLGTQRGYGPYLGLPDDWAVPVIAAVGNYGELFDRTLGPHSVMRLARGPNNLSTQGGLMLAAPIR